MSCRNKVCRTFALIALALISLSGCGDGSSSGVVTTAATTAPATTAVPAASTTPALHPPDEVPETPTGVSVVGGTNKVTISWNAASDATSYNIYWATTTGVTTATGTRIAVAGNTIILKALLPAATYYYVVTAQNSSGESVASPQVATTTATLDGATPYNTYCVGCHGPLANSTVTNMSVTQINTALQDVSPMFALSLTDSQIAAISAALMYNN